MTYNEYLNAPFADLYLAKVEDIPETVMHSLKRELEFGKGIFENKATRVYLVSDDGKRVFSARRERGGKKEWTISYYVKRIGITRNIHTASGYGFGVVANYIKRTKDGTDIPKKVSDKSEVLEILNHIQWCKARMNKGNG